MKKIFTLLVCIFTLTSISAQEIGDTLKVKVFDFNSSTRDTVINFPTVGPDITFEKIILKYTMRCHDGLINPGNNSQGCGEWDFSCNTYLIDSTKIEQFLTTTPSHIITDFDDPLFFYKETPVFNYNRSVETIVDVTNTISEEETIIGGSDNPINETLATHEGIGKSQYIYTAAELLAGGLAPGEIDAISLEVLDDAGEAQFLEIKMKNTDKTTLNERVDFTGFTKVYDNTVELEANQLNRFHFATPFEWDGISNVLIEYNFSNIDGSNTAGTSVAGEQTSFISGLHNEDDTEVRLTNNAWIECNDYAGITGNTNRTVEMWVKTTDTRNSEICAWGLVQSGQKWTFRLQQGRLRLEVEGGNTQGSTPINDGEWHHIAIVQDGPTLSNIKFYIDGQLNQQQATGTAAINTGFNETTPLRISRGLQNRYFESFIDEFRMWDVAVDQQTIAKWSNLKVDENHPNYDNLQVYYEFDEEGLDVYDSSINGRDARINGNNIRMSQALGSELFKDFTLQNQRPRVHFYQGEYETNETEVIVDKPISKNPRHFVVERTIVPGDPNVVKDDEILSAESIELWTVDQSIFDAVTGALIETVELEEDGIISIQDLSYTRRFPFYNELVSFVTPYGFFLDLGPNGETWYMDMSDYVSILNGRRRIQMTLGGQNNEEYDMEFQFIVGTPPRDVVQFEQLWQGTNRIGIARIDQVIDDSKFAPITMPLSAEAETFNLKSSITGHGVQGEFSQNGGVVFHNIDMNGEPVFIWDITQECAFNPIFPQGGTWVFDREGWCPGEQTFMNQQDFTEVATPGEDIVIDYGTTNPPVSTGDYRYHVAHQVVGYGPANFTQDASIMRVMAPNNTAEFKRVGNICNNPVVVIRNTGATDLTELTINYWMNGSINPQTFQWTGNLEFMEEEEVELPSTAEFWSDILEEGNVFYAEIASTNGGTDEYVYNNSISSTFDVPTVYPTNVVIDIRTNFNANENNYQILDTEGNVVASNSLPVASTTYVDELDLELGCYKFVMNDSGHDGLEFFANPGQGVGWVRIRDTDNNLLANFDPDFGGGFEINFNTEFPVSVEDFNFLKSIKVFPNPTTDYVMLAADDLKDAKISVIDVLGQTHLAPVLTRDNESVSLDFAGLNSGIYFVLIEKGEVVTTRKVVVE